MADVAAAGPPADRGGGSGNTARSAVSTLHRAGDRPLSQAAVSLPARPRSAPVPCRPAHARGPSDTHQCARHGQRPAPPLGDRAEQTARHCSRSDYSRLVCLSFSLFFGGRDWLLENLAHAARSRLFRVLLTSGIMQICRHLCRVTHDVISNLSGCLGVE